MIARFAEFRVAPVSRSERVRVAVARGRALALSIVALSAFVGCGPSRAGISLSTGRGDISLYALSAPAKSCELAGGETAWFVAKGALDATSPSSIEVTVSRRVADAGAGAGAGTGAGGDSDDVSITLAPVFARDLDSSGRLVAGMAPRAVAKVIGLPAGTLSLALELPAGTGTEEPVGFAVGSLVSEAGSEAGSRDSGAKASVPRVRILSASLRPAETGWDRSPTSPWFGFSREGGSANLADIDSHPPAIRGVVESSVARITVAAASRDELGTPARPARVSFRSGGRAFGFRAAPQDYVARVPAALISGDGTISPASGSDRLVSVRVSPEASRPASPSTDANVPIPADPHMILDWPVSLWRDARREVFSWDRFPSILIFDTADYAVQDKYFKRLAFFTEKKGFRGRLAPDSEIASLHGFNAHDYRAESLAAFFELARVGEFPLGAEELDLLDILLARGVVVREGKRLVPGAGAVLSVSRESVGYLRQLFMTHECLHGVYFTDPGFRARVSEVRAGMNPTAIEFLTGYFTVVPGLEYDSEDAYLMENEFMAYVLQQSLPRVGDYFSKNLLERYLRHGGSREVADYIARTGASDFVKAAGSLEEYCFARWGFSAGRVGLWFSSGSGD